MKRKLIGILIASAFTLPAIAQTTTPSTSSTATSVAVGGGGGTGGSAAGGTAAGGSATASSGGNAAGGSSTVSLSVTLPSSTSGTSSGTSGTSGTTSSPTGTSSAAGDPAGTTSTVNYGGTYTVKTVPNIVAPSLTTTLSDTCMGSASFGLSFTGFGATGGTTMVDQACVRRLDSREFRAMGLNDVALALLCQSEANRKAVESTGRSCPGMERAAAPAAPATPAAAPSASSTSTVGQNSINNIGDQYKDPLIRARLGLDTLSALTAR